MNALARRFLDAVATHSVGMPRTTQTHVVAAYELLNAGEFTKAELLCIKTRVGREIWLETVRGTEATA